MRSFSRYIKAIEECLRWGQILNKGNRVCVQLSGKLWGKTGSKRKEGCYG